MRVPFVPLALTLLWLVALWPVALFVVALSSPLAAVQLATAAQARLVQALMVAGIALAIAAVVFPPVPAGLRLLFARLRLRLTTDRGPLLRALDELRHVETAARHHDAGRAALTLGDLALAKKHLERARELEPTNVATRYLWAQLALQAGALPPARAEFAAVVAVDPGHAFGEALLLLGRTTDRLGEHQAARDLLLRHQREHGGNRRSHYWLAQACAAAGDRDGANAALRVAAAKPLRGKLTPDENWYRAWARVASWRRGAIA